MPENTEITAALSFPTPLPPDQDCPPATANEFLQLVADNVVVVARDPDAPQSQTDSTAELALNAANNALQQVSTLQGQIPARRTSGSLLIPLSTGGSHVPLSWQPAMPNANYAVYITFHGPDTAANDPQWCVENGTRNVGSVLIRMMDVPAGSWSFSFEVVAL